MYALCFTSVDDLSPWDLSCLPPINTGRLREIPSLTSLQGAVHSLMHHPVCQLQVLIIVYSWFRNRTHIRQFKGKFATFAPSLEEEEIGTILCAERWCCLSSLLGYWAQSWMGHHSDTVYQHAGTHFAYLGRMTGRVNATWY